MQIGVSFSSEEIGTDPLAARDFAQAAEALGYRHLRLLDHVLGADVTHRDAKEFPYTHKSAFHEPFVFFGYLAGLTRTIGLCTAVLVVTQRQTALVAKQAAALDVLSGGRVRLGMGTGWNKVEYEALGEDFATRGKRLDEQIAVLRALWTKEVVTFEGAWHRIIEAGINPLPVQRPIPLWFGGASEPAYRRIGSVGDGWIPFSRDKDALGATARGIERIHHYARQAGRDPARIGLDGRIWLKDSAPGEWPGICERWRQLGCTHLTLATGGAGFARLDQHIEVLRRFKEAVPLIP